MLCEPILNILNCAVGPDKPPDHHAAHFVSGRSREASCRVTSNPFSDVCVEPAILASIDADQGVEGAPTGDAGQKRDES